MNRRFALILVGLAVVAAGCGGADETDQGDTGGAGSVAVTVTTSVSPETRPGDATSTTAAPSSTTAPSATTATIAPDPAGPDPAPRGVVVHVFPLDPPSVGSYSAGVHGYPATDIFAPVGTPFVAVTSGTIQGVSRVDDYDPSVDDPALRSGLFVSLIGDDGVRYYGSHLSDVAPGVEAGVRVEAGQLLGHVGASGNAAGTSPHLHFGISRPTALEDWDIRRGEVDPLRFLDAWRAGDTTVTPTLP